MSAFGKATWGAEGLIPLRNDDSEWIQRGGIQLPPTQPTVLTVAEVADRLRVSKMTVYRLLHGGDLRCVRVRESYRVPEAALRDYLTRGEG